MTYPPFPQNAPDGQQPPHGPGGQQAPYGPGGQQTPYVFGGTNAAPTSQAPSFPTYGPVGQQESIPPQAPAPSKTKHRRLLTAIIGGGLLLVGALVALGISLSGPDEQDLTVRLGLFDLGGGSDCDGGDGGYDDVGPGMPITVKDEVGTVIGSTTIDSGGESMPGVGCIWTMHLKVSSEAKQYVIEGGSRGGITFSHDDLAAADWTAELSLGE
jgi:hypothetical protein